MNNNDKMPVRCLDLFDRKVIEEALQRNDSIYSIGFRIGFSDKAIHKEIERNSVNGKYIAEEAQNMANLRRENRISKSIETIHKQNKLKERVDALEEFCKTLSNLIEELYDKINK